MASESHDHPRLLASGWGRALGASVGLLAIATLAGLALLWPGGDRPDTRAGFGGGKTVDAHVDALRDRECPGPAPQRCRQLRIEVDGKTTLLTLGPVESAPDVDAGQDIRVARAETPPGATGVEPYTFVGIDRTATLLWLTLAFAALVILLTRWRGVLALAGFGLSLLLVVKFIVPAIAEGTSPLAVAAVGSMAVMFVTVGLTYGLSAQSAAAALGIAGSLLFAALVGTAAVHAAHLDGSQSEYSAALSQAGAGISFEGIVIAGLVIGALGVLADMAVTQASAVMALRRANPELRGRPLFEAAFGVGRDHLVATTHTLVLAYVGATLPLLLVLYSIGSGTSDAINSEDIAEPIVATLVGAMALLLSVPLTTFLATALMSRAPVGTIPEGHDHPH
jgi:uncharacterized membrane protein